MITAELNDAGDRVQLRGTSPHAHGPRVKRLFGARYRGGVWELPLTWVTVVTLRGTFGAELDLGPRLLAWCWQKREGVDQVREARALAVAPEGDAPGDERLWSFQRTGVAFMDAGESLILADDMGSGKTVQASVYARHVVAKHPGRVLVICPKGVLRAWRDALREWAGLDSWVVSGSQVQRRKILAAAGENDALIMTYDVLKTHTRYASYGSTALVLCDQCGGLDPSVRTMSCEVHPRELSDQRWSLVIADEAHQIKDPRAKQTRAVHWVGDRAERRLALTGTPIDKSVDELWSLWRFVARDDVPSKSRYIDRWCQKSFNFFGGLEVTGINPEHEGEFRSLLELRFVRRPKELIAPHLPKKVHVTRLVQMTPKQKKAYDQLVDGMVADLDGGTLTTFSPLVQGMRLSQFAAATCTIEGTKLVRRRDPDTREMVDVEVDDVRMTDPSPKIDELLEVLEELGDLPLVVLGASRQLLDLAVARLSRLKVPFARVVGGMEDEQIESEREAYNAGRARVILISLGAAATGLSLTRGSHVVFLDRHWRSLLNKQGIDRLHGIGRGDAGAENLTVIDIITEGTIEEHKMLVLGGKDEAMEALVRDRDALRAVLTHGRG